MILSIVIGSIIGELINIEKVSDAIRFLVDKFLLTQVIEKNDIVSSVNKNFVKNLILYA